MTIKLICIDADDTLWHNMRHFNATEEALVAMLQPFADAHVAREALTACEVRTSTSTAMARRASPFR
jgi:putative hydrolase of the HAD superfamily